jgi:hypothetical protein
MGHFMGPIFYAVYQGEFYTSTKRIQMKKNVTMVPDSFLEKLNEKQDQIIDLLKST